MKGALLIPLLAAALLAGGCSAPGPAGAGRDTAADAIVEKLAAQGDAEAQVTLGWMHETGHTVAKDPVAAARWYRAAAKQGDALAQYYLAELYARGTGVPEDQVEAAAWYRRAAERGNPLAQLRLGRMYERGIGVDRNYATAAEWYAHARRRWGDRASYPPGDNWVIGRLPAPPSLIPPQPEDLGDRVMAARRPTPPAGSLEAAMAEWKARQGQAGEAEIEGTAPPDASGLWVHVASFRALPRARQYRTEIMGRHNDLLGALRVTLSRVDLGADKGVWIRVRAGPIPNMAAAATLCRGLRTRDLYCATMAP